MQRMSMPRSGEEASCIPRPRRAAEVVVDVLVQHGVRCVFGIPGGPISPIHDALLDRPEIRVVTTRHESGAMFAAAAYAQTTGMPGVVLVTSGPGVLNAMTGLASAYCDGLPLVLLAGEVPRKLHGRGAIQDGSAYHLNVATMARQICKLALEVPDANVLPSMLHLALTTAVSGRRGPVTLTLPLDTTTAPIFAPQLAFPPPGESDVDARAIERVVDLLAISRRTVILAGSGVRGGDAPARLVEVAERLGCPVVTTHKGKGVFPEDHPLALGVFGIGGHPSAREWLEVGHDLLLAVGTSFSDLSTEGWSATLKPRQALVHVDVDPARLGRGYPVTLGIAASAGTFFTRLLARLPHLTSHPSESPSGVRTYTSPEGTLVGDEGRLAPQRALWEIAQVLPDDTIYTCDIGEHTLFATHYLRVNRSDGFILMSGLGSMGSALGSALGAKLARPARTVAAICGDGGFAMMAAELSTAVAERVPFLVFVLNDERLGMVEIGHASVYGRMPSYPTGPMRIPELAASLGATSLVADGPGAILRAPELRAPLERPVVVDVRIDRSIRMPKKDRLQAMGGPAPAPKGK